MKQRICIVFVTFNLIFWLSIAFGYSVNSFATQGSVYTLIQILLYLEPILFMILLFGILKRINLIYILGLILTLSNTVLSITDDLGWLDVTALVLSFTTFLILVICKPLKP